MHRTGVSLFALVLCLCAVHPARAQVFYGSIVGTVTDPTGAAVPNAKVTAASKAINEQRDVVTDAEGRFTISNLQAGEYEVTVTAPGFRTFTQKAAQVTINTVYRVNATLDVGQVTEQVTVEASAASLQTDKADVHVELGSRVIESMPLANYRNYQSLINLVPGATPARFQNANTDTPARALTTNINGTNRNNNNTKLDGASNVFIWLPHHTVYVAPAETVETVNVSTNNFDSDQGMAGGAAITVVTKSGTNDLHGAAFGYLENSKFGAKNFFFRDPQTPKGIRTIPGFVVGGPIRKDKLFFFGGYEGLFERTNRNALFTVPTAEQRAGDFSGTGATIFDPTTGNPDGSGRVPFLNNTIPAARLSPIAQKIQDLIPLPNGAGFDNNFFNAASQSMNRKNLDVKINYNPTEKFRMFGRYGYMQADVTGQYGLGAIGGDCLCDGGAGNGDTSVNVATVGYSYSVTPRTLYDATYGFTRMGHQTFGNDFGKNWGTEVFGIPGTNGNDPRQTGLPAFFIEGYSNLGNAEGWIPAFRNDQSFTTSQNFSHLRGAHEIRFGFEGVRHHLNHWQPELGPGPRGAFHFNQGLTGAPDAETTQFNAYAGFLLGLTSDAGKSIQYEKMTTYEWQFGWYVRDRWQVTPKLTATLGVRYELYPLMTRAGRGGIEDYDPNTNTVQLGGAGGLPKGLGISTSHKLFAPRVGLAFRATDTTVIRTGYGITINPMVLSRPLRGFYPLTVAQTFVGPNSFQAYGTLTQGIPDFGGPDVSTGVVSLPETADMRFITDKHLKRGYIQSWNFIVERQLPAGFVGSVGYVGTSTVNSFADWNGNAAAPGTGRAGQPFFQKFGRTADTLFWNGFVGAHYHSLQASVNRSLAQGLSLKGAYTYGKAINYTDDDGWAGMTFNWSPMLGRNRATAGYDRTHIFQMGYVYELPFGKGKKMATSGIARAVAGGWQVNGIFSAYTGTPFTVTASGAGLNAPGNTQTADQVKPTVEKIGTTDQFYDTSAFAPVAAARFGTVGRNTLRGPGQVNLDLGIFRDFAMTERAKLTFKAEAFNLSNTPHFNNPGSNNQTSVTDSSFMRITSAQADQRVIRFGLRIGF